MVRKKFLPEESPQVVNLIQHQPISPDLVESMRIVDQAVLLQVRPLRQSNFYLGEFIWLFSFAKKAINELGLP